MFIYLSFYLSRESIVGIVVTSLAYLAFDFIIDIPVECRKPSIFSIFSISLNLPFFLSSLSFYFYLFPYFYIKMQNLLFNLHFWTKVLGLKSRVLNSLSPFVCLLLLSSLSLPLFFLLKYVFPPSFNLIFSM